VIGYEVQTALAAVDWLEATHEPDGMVGVCGRGGTRGLERLHIGLELLEPIEDAVELVRDVGGIEGGTCVGRRLHSAWLSQCLIELVADVLGKLGACGLERLIDELPNIGKGLVAVAELLERLRMGRAVGADDRDAALHPERAASRRWLLARAFLHLLGEPLDRLPHGLGVLLRCDPGLLSLFLGLGQHVFGSVGSFGTRGIDMPCRPVGWAGLVDHDFSGAIRLNLDLYPDLDRFLRV
jgi:hypothetical protein